MWPEASHLDVSVGGHSTGWREALVVDVLVWLVLASGSGLTGAGIGRISWSVCLARMVPGGLSKFF